MELDRAHRERIETLYKSFEGMRRDFPQVAKPGTENKAEIARRDILDLAENVDIRIPLDFDSHRPIIGPLIVFAKKLLTQIASPIIKVCFHRQLLVNNHVLSLATQLADIEARLSKLEERLAKH